MVKSCSAYKCTNRFDKNKNISFFSFPFQRPDIFLRWRAAMRRKDWFPTLSSYLCSEHFLPEDFEVIKNERHGRHLKPDAVPSQFDFSPHIPKKGSKQNKQNLVQKKKKTHQYKPKGRREPKKTEACENTGCKDLAVHYPEQGKLEPLLKERFRLRSTAVPSLRLPENSKEGEVKRFQRVKRNILDTECMKSGLHQEDTIKLSNGDSSGGKKNCSNYSDSDDNKMSETESISLDDNVKNKHPISMEMSDSERITDSEEDSECGLQENIFDPGSFSSSTDNVEEMLTRKLELVTGLYEKSWKKMKFYQKKCKLHAKQSIALKEVIESLKQINSVPNDL